MTPSDDIRSLVAHLVREQINDVIREELTSMTVVAPEGAGPDHHTAAPAPHPGQDVRGSTRPAAHCSDRSAPGVSTSRGVRRGERVEQVDVTSDGELNSFARQLLKLFENPKNRDDLREGRLTFRLNSVPRNSTTAPGLAAGQGPRRIASGVVSERAVIEAARNGTALAVAPGVVVTPLALDKARSLNVHIERETR